TRRRPGGEARKIHHYSSRVGCDTVISFEALAWLEASRAASDLAIVCLNARTLLNVDFDVRVVAARQTGRVGGAARLQKRQRGTAIDETVAPIQRAGAVLDQSGISGLDKCVADLARRAART